MRAARWRGGVFLVLLAGPAAWFQPAAAQVIDLSPMDAGAAEQDAEYNQGEQIYTELLNNALDTGNYNPNDCSDDPCLNGGSCDDGTIISSTTSGQQTSFVCRCAFGWVGLRCQTEVNPCALGSLIERQGQLSVHAYAPHDCDPDFAACVQTSPGEYRCDCTAGYETVTVGRSCTDIDECASSPCENDSTCTESSASAVVPLSAFSCRCPIGFTNGMCSYEPIPEFSAACQVLTGGRCDIDLDECASNPCQNGAVCGDSSTAISPPVPLDSFSCSCLTGFANGRCPASVHPLVNYTLNCTTPATENGAVCDIDVNECLSSPCQNNAMECVDVVADFECRCAPGWVDQDCSRNYDECVSNPCLRGGDCFDRISNYYCACTVGWTGHDCEADLDECLSIPCQNGANCTDSSVDVAIPINAYSCSCSTGFSGGDCEIDFDECLSDPCRASTTVSCIDGADAFFCTCIPGYTGETCQLEIDPCALGADDCDPSVSYCSHTGPALFECTCHWTASWSSSWSNGRGSGSGSGSGSQSYAQGCTNATVNPALLIYHGPAKLCLDRNDTWSEPCPSNLYGNPYDNGPVCNACQLDQCGICDCNSTNNCPVDCTGVWGGDAVTDLCGVCDGASDLCLDCAGVLYGMHQVDQCGSCDNSTADDCTLDCFGTWGGNGTSDVCGVCGGSNQSCTIAAVGIGLQLQIAGSVSGDTLARAGEALANEAVLNMSANLTGVVAYGGTVRFDSQAGALNASAQVDSYRQLLDFDLRIPGTTTLYSNETETGRLARHAFMVGMASALGCRVAHVDLHGIVDARRRLQMPMLSVEWVTLSYSVDTDVNAADELYGTGFIRAFAEGITAAGVILPGLDLLTITDNGLATACDVTVTTAFPVEMLHVKQQLEGNLSDISLLSEHLPRYGLVRGDDANLTVAGRFLAIDCTGVHNGRTLFDNCTVCGGNNSMCADCGGEAYGPLMADECGGCDADWATNCLLDCSGVWGGGAEPNPCGVCAGDVSMCFTWGCDGIEGSPLSIDECGECGGNGTVCLDCANMTYGVALIDYCGTCDDDPTNDCVADCYGVWGGNLTLDSCGVCDGDNSSCVFSTHAITVSLVANGTMTRNEIAFSAASVAQAASDYRTGGPVDTWYGGRSTDYRNSTARIENATAHIDYYLQTIEFQIRLPGIEDLYDNISRSRLLSLADDTDGEGGFRTVEDWRTSASPDLQLMQFVIAMAQTISLPIENVTLLNVTTAPGCVDDDLVPYTGFPCDEFIVFFREAGLQCDSDLTPMAALFLLPVVGTLGDYCSVTCELCEENTLGTPWGTASYAWVFFNFVTESNTSKVATLTDPLMGSDFGWNINHIPGFDPLPGMDHVSLMDHVNNTWAASELAQYDVVLELPCIDLPMLDEWNAPNECDWSGEQLRSAGLGCEQTWADVWRWQVSEGIANIFDIQHEMAFVFEVVSPVVHWDCLEWNNNTVDMNATNATAWDLCLDRFVDDGYGPNGLSPLEFAHSADWNNNTIDLNATNETAWELCLAEFLNLTDVNGTFNSSNTTVTYEAPDCLNSTTWRTLLDHGLLNESDSLTGRQHVTFTAQGSNLSSVVANSSFNRMLALSLERAGPAIPSFMPGEEVRLISPEFVTNAEVTFTTLVAAAEDIRTGLAYAAQLRLAAAHYGANVSVTYATAVVSYDSFITRRITARFTIFGSIELSQFQAAVIRVVDLMSGRGAAHTVDSLNLEISIWQTALQAAMTLRGPAVGQVADWCPKSCFTRCNSSLYAHLTYGNDEDSAPSQVRERLSDEVLSFELYNATSGMLEAIEVTVDAPRLLPVDCRANAGGGVAVDGCTVCGGTNLCLDCEGVPYGRSWADPCGTCDVDRTNDCVLDCLGEWGGPVFSDGCGVCGGRGELCYDCADVPFGENLPDECLACDLTPENDCTTDCFGVWGGVAIIDQCNATGLGVCNGSNASCADCNEIPYGGASLDVCATCDNNSTNDCEMDCAGVWGGPLELDECDVCGGNSSTCLGCD